jgi:hypothetical protein
VHVTEESATDIGAGIHIGQIRALRAPREFGSSADSRRQLGLCLIARAMNFDGNKEPRSAQVSKHRTVPIEVWPSPQCRFLGILAGSKIGFAADFQPRPYLPLRRVSNVKFIILSHVREPLELPPNVVSRFVNGIRCCPTKEVAFLRHEKAIYSRF